MSPGDPILDKIWSVPPHQDVLVAEPVAPVSSGQPLKVVMIGHDFIRKGGEPLLDALDSVGDELDVHLTVVSSVSRLDYACPAWDSQRLTEVRRRLANHPRVTWQVSLPNPAVIDLICDSHLGVLPTLADTYGYSLLEFMACGLPVIGSSVQAGPEIVDDTVGWRVAVDVDRSGDWTGLQTPASRRHSAYEEARAQVADQLTAIMREARAHPEELARRGGAALQHVRQAHGSQRARRLREVYDESLGVTSEPAQGS